MKVLHVYRTYFPDPPGGLQEAIRQICISTQAFGVSNTIFTLSPSPTPSVIQRPEATVVRCRSWAAPASCDLGSVDAFKTFRKLANEADVIHYLFPWPFGDLLRLAAPEKPTVLTYISDIVRQKWQGRIYAPLMWNTLRSVDTIVTNAPGYAQTSTILQHESLRHRLHQIPLGVDEGSFRKDEDPAILKRLGLADDEPFLLFIGVLRYYKGLHVLLDACPNIKGKVVIAGSGPEGDGLHAQATRMGLSNVIFANQVTDAEKTTLLKHCRTLVLPSHLRSEAYGMVLVEASMFAKPMISCEIGTGTSFINVDNETGFVVTPESPEAIANAANQLLEDSTQAQRLGQGARLRYEKLFSGNALGSAYSKLYQTVCEAKARHR